MILMDTVEELVKGADTVVKILPINGHDVKVTLTREGQDAPSSSDKVRVGIKVSLPTEDGYVVRDLCFGERVTLMYEWLHTAWGDREEGGARFTKRYCLGVTWREAAEKAVIQVGTDLARLLIQVDMRKQALENADEKH